MKIPGTLLVTINAGIAGAFVVAALMADKQEAPHCDLSSVGIPASLAENPGPPHVADPVRVIEVAAPEAPAPTGVEQLRRVTPVESEALQQTWAPAPEAAHPLEWDNCPGCGMG